MSENPEFKWVWGHLAQLTSRQLEKMFALRQQVFVVEQQCIYLDIDGKDSRAQHLLAWQGDELVATLRVFESYKEYNDHASIGRICVLEKARKYGLGKELVQRAIDYIKLNYIGKEIQIGAQYYLKNFYQGFGFNQVSEIYDEDGIDHIHMRLNFLEK